MLVGQTQYPVGQPRQKRSLKIKGPMSGCGISSNNHITKRKLQRNWALLQMITILVDIMRKGENEPKKINGWVNGKHVTCHSE